MARRVWRYEPGHPLANERGFVEVTDPNYFRLPETDARNFVVVDRYMEGTRSPVDGSDIGSRRKRREHMKVHSLVDADDFKNTWANEAKKRAEFYTRQRDPEVRREIERALHLSMEGKLQRRGNG